MIYLSKSVQMKKETLLHLGWPDGFNQIFISGQNIYLNLPKLFQICCMQAFVFAALQRLSHP